MEYDILEFEKKYWEAMANRDYDTAKGLTKFPCIIAGKNGVMSVDEPALKKMFEQGGSKSIKINGISDEQVQTGNDHAIIGYLIELNYDGNAMKCACTSTWIKEGGKWRCAMHTESDLEKKQE